MDLQGLPALKVFRVWPVRLDQLVQLGRRVMSVLLGLQVLHLRLLALPDLRVQLVPLALPDLPELLALTVLPVLRGLPGLLAVQAQLGRLALLQIHRPM